MKLKELFGVMDFDKLVIMKITTNQNDRFGVEADMIIARGKREFNAEFKKLSKAKAYREMEVLSLDINGGNIIVGCSKHNFNEKNIEVLETEKHDENMYSFIGEVECEDCDLTLRLNGEGTQPSDEEMPD